MWCYCAWMSLARRQGDYVAGVAPTSPHPQRMWNLYHLLGKRCSQQCCLRCKPIMQLVQAVKPNALDAEHVSLRGASGDPAAILFGRRRPWQQRAFDHGPCKQTWSHAIQQLCPSLGRPAPPPRRQPKPATFCGGRYVTIIILLTLFGLNNLWLFTAAIIALFRCIASGSRQIIKVAASTKPTP